MKIYTHVSLDIDAASTVALLMMHLNTNIENVEFVPADWEGPLQEKDIAVDISLGIKGINSSAFTEIHRGLPEGDLKEAFKPLSKFINSYDKTGQWTSLYPIDKKTGKEVPTMLTVFHALKETADNDKELLAFWHIIIVGIYQSYESLQIAKKQVRRVEWPYPEVAVIRGKTKPQLCSLLFSKGAKFIVYEEGNTMGVMRSPDHWVNVGTLLKPHFPDWFHHPDGFLSCWGSRKSPKETPPNTSTERVTELVSTIITQ